MSSQAPNATVLRKHSRVLVEFCAAVKPKEKVLLIFDGTTRAIEPYLREAAHRAKAHIAVEYMQASIMHCIEPPTSVISAMARADVILAMTKYSLAHTDARFRATNRGARYLSLPQYGIEQLSRPSLSVEFLALADTGKRIKKILDKGGSAHITTKKGTDLEVFFKGRIANWAPGYCHEPGMLGSPPDIETNVATLETRSKGVLVVDGSIPCESIGLLSQPVRLTVAHGRIASISTNREGRILKTLLGAVSDKKRTVLAEFGIGLNPKARLSGLMLEDEGCLGTVHFGFGSNATIGGKNKTAFHLDMVIRKPTVTIDGVPFMKEGTLTFQ